MVELVGLTRRWHFYLFTLKYEGVVVVVAVHVCFYTHIPGRVYGNVRLCTLCACMCEVCVI